MVYDSLADRFGKREHVGPDSVATGEEGKEVRLPRLAVSRIGRRGSRPVPAVIEEKTGLADKVDTSMAERRMRADQW